MKTEYIYALYDVRTGDYFYVGRTNDLTRRMGEHLRNARAGHTEHKYQKIRQIEDAASLFDYELLDTIVDVSQPYEEFWVYQLLCEGCDLTNMKAGDAKQAAEADAMRSMQGRGARYSDAATFLDARQREVEEAAARAATARLHARAKRQERAEEDWDPMRVLFDYERVDQKFVSPWMREREARRLAEKGRGHVHRGPIRK
ncbi:GIY-YIG nuclease family protein [Leptothrix discophora]|uniref:GIY-YIG nuclease family protein n=1 Tax=Leptothrix discophora TaxID=89 RepID=A0ABT9G0F6_LEPDI|nr:GIY-YIG nuclease family protein [Leptothrix discophora]MDP4299946.1 GIY-YIG nuclease family protein [Leptothrix discophora]